MSNQMERRENGTAQVNRAGSCGILIMSINKDVYIVNVGDSRAVMSQNQMVKQVSTDHKPTEKTEFDRINANGGKIY